MSAGRTPNAVILLKEDLSMADFDNYLNEILEKGGEIVDKNFMFKQITANFPADFSQDSLNSLRTDQVSTFDFDDKEFTIQG